MTWSTASSPVAGEHVVDQFWFAFMDPAVDLIDGMRAPRLHSRCRSPLSPSLVPSGADL